MEADQRGCVLLGPAILAAEHHIVGRRDCQVADRKLVQRGRETLLLEEIAGRDVDIDERRLHVGDVQLIVAAIGMGLDAAIGDHHGAAVAEQRDVVRLHAVRGKLADLPVAVRRVAHADHTRGALIVVLRGVEQPAIGREHAVAEEVTVGLGGEPDRRPCIERDRDAEAARPPRESDPFAAVGLERDVVAALRQLDRPHIAVEGEQRGREIAPVVPARGGEAFGLGTAAAAPGRASMAALEARLSRNARRSSSMASLHPWR